MKRQWCHISTSNLVRKKSLDTFIMLFMQFITIMVISQHVLVPNSLLNSLLEGGSFHQCAKKQSQNDNTFAHRAYLLQNTLLPLMCQDCGSAISNNQIACWNNKSFYYFQTKSKATSSIIHKTDFNISPVLIWVFNKATERWTTEQEIMEKVSTSTQSEQHSKGYCF